MGVQTMSTLNYQSNGSTPNHNLSNCEDNEEEDVRVNQENDTQATAMDTSRANEDTTVVHAIINAGADVDGRGGQGAPSMENNPVPVMKLLVNGKSFDVDDDFPPTPSCLTPPPSENEVKEVLGVYSDHLSNSRTPNVEDQRKDISVYSECKMVHDDTLESIHLVDKILAEAPRQKVDESEL